MLIDDLGEDGLLRELRVLFGASDEDVQTGIGDDAAIIGSMAERPMSWTSDLIIEDIHFRRSWQTGEELGRKCLMVNISDLASMAAEPRFALVSLAIPRGTEADYVLEICRGIKNAADESGVTVVGGDTTASPGFLVINVTLGGYLRGRPLRRSDARPREVIAVTGELGGALAGMRLLELGEHESFPGLTRSFRLPANRVVAAIAARDHGAGAMTDLSDGLATDLRHLCEESGCGAVIDLESLPYPSELPAACSAHGWDMDDILVAGGEEYELLFTLPADDAVEEARRIAGDSGSRVTLIGTVEPLECGLMMRRRDGEVTRLAAEPYEHFSR